MTSDVLKDKYWFRTEVRMGELWNWLNVNSLSNLTVREVCEYVAPLALAAFEEIGID